MKKVFILFLLIYGLIVFLMHNTFDLPKENICIAAGGSGYSKAMSYGFYNALSKTKTLALHKKEVNDCAVFVENPSLIHSNSRNSSCAAVASFSSSLATYADLLVFFKNDKKVAIEKLNHGITFLNSSQNCSATPKMQKTLKDEIAKIESSEPVLGAEMEQYKQALSTISMLTLQF